MLKPTDPVSITLEQRQWNDVLQALHEAPFRVAAPIIGEIMRQYEGLVRASDAPPALEPEVTAHLTNGAGPPPEPPPA